VCHNPFLLFNQAAIFSAQGKVGNKYLADLVKKPLPQTEESCTALYALNITARADCLRLLSFEDEANFLCAYVAKVCSLHRHSVRPDLHWDGRWEIVSIQNSIVRSLVVRGHHFAEDVLMEFEEGKKDSVALCRKLQILHTGPGDSGGGGGGDGGGEGTPVAHSAVLDEHREESVSAYNQGVASSSKGRRVLFHSDTYLEGGRYLAAVNHADGGETTDGGGGDGGETTDGGGGGDCETTDGGGGGETTDGGGGYAGGETTDGGDGDAYAGGETTDYAGGETTDGGDGDAYAGGETTDGGDGDVYPGGETTDGGDDDGYVTGDVTDGGGRATGDDRFAETGDGGAKYTGDEAYVPTNADAEDSDRSITEFADV